MIQKTISLSIFLIAINTCVAQNKFDIKDFTYNVWKNECNYLSVKVDSFMYADRVDSETINCAIASLNESRAYKRNDLVHKINIQDSIVFTQSEISYLKNVLRKSISHIWKENLFPKSKRVPQEQVSGIIDSIDKTSLSFDKKYCMDIFTFSEPIFLRNETFCVFLLEIDNVMKKQSGLWIYKKEGGEWIKFAPLCYLGGLNNRRK